MHVHFKDKNVSRFDQYNVEKVGSAMDAVTRENPKEHWYNFWRGVRKDNPGVVMFGRVEGFTGGYVHYQEWLIDNQHGNGRPLLVTSCWHYNFENEH